MDEVVGLNHEIGLLVPETMLFGSEYWLAFIVTGVLSRLTHQNIEVID
jgi:hypothetical protein